MASNIKINNGIISSILSGIAVITLIAILPLGFGDSRNVFKIFSILYFISIAMAMLGAVFGMLGINKPKKTSAAIGLFFTFTIFLILFTISFSLVDYTHGF